MESKIMIKGMHCKSCEEIIKESLREVKGMISLKISAAKGEAIVNFDESKCSLEDIKNQIKSEGYRV